MSYALREALAAFRRTPVIALLAVLLVAMALYLPAVFGMASITLSQALRTLEARVEVVAWLQDDTQDTEIELARRELSLQPEIGEVGFVSPDSALVRARQTLDDFGNMLDDLERNPLPASLELRLADGLRDADAVARVASLVASYPFVERVDYGRDWVERLFEIRRIALTASVGLGALFAAVAVLLIILAMRISLAARRTEIEVLRLVGAREVTVRLPFVLGGLITGLLGALIAAGLARVTFVGLRERFVDLLWLPNGWLFGGLALGALLGVVASGVGLQRSLRSP